MSNQLSPGNPLVCVVWSDAHGRESGEFTEDEIMEQFHEAAPIHTFGLLIKDDGQGVTIAQEWTNPDGGKPTFRGLGFVPRGMVKEVIHLGVPKQKMTRKPKPPPESTP